MNEMKISWARNGWLLGIGLLLTACSTNMVDVKPGSDKVVVARPDNVTFCKQIGTANVSVVAEVGIFSRSVDAINADLKQLGRNAAVDQGGDTIVGQETSRIGEKTWLIYRCRGAQP